MWRILQAKCPSGISTYPAIVKAFAVIVKQGMVRSALHEVNNEDQS
jgi:hypothetical protein